MIELKLNWRTKREFRIPELHEPSLFWHCVNKHVVGLPFDAEEQAWFDDYFSAEATQTPPQQ